MAISTSQNLEILDADRQIEAIIQNIGDQVSFSNSIEQESIMDSQPQIEINAFSESPNFYSSVENSPPSSVLNPNLLTVKHTLVERQDSFDLLEQIIQKDLKEAGSNKNSKGNQTKFQMEKNQDLTSFLLAGSTSNSPRTPDLLGNSALNTPEVYKFLTNTNANPLFAATEPPGLPFHTPNDGTPNLCSPTPMQPDPRMASSPPSTADASPPTGSLTPDANRVILRPAWPASTSTTASPVTQADSPRPLYVKAEPIQSPMTSVHAGNANYIVVSPPASVDSSNRPDSIASSTPYTPAGSGMEDSEDMEMDLSATAPAALGRRSAPMRPVTRAGGRRGGGVNVLKPVKQERDLEMADRVQSLLAKKPPRKYNRNKPNKDTDEYRARRERNNIAVRASRAKAKLKNEDLKVENERLVDQNRQLTLRLEEVLQENKILQDMLKAERQRNGTATPATNRQGRHKTTWPSL